NLERCRLSFPRVMSEGFTGLLSRPGASRATRPESVSLGRTCTDWVREPSLDTPTGQRLRYRATVPCAVACGRLVTSTLVCLGLSLRRRLLSTTVTSPTSRSEVRLAKVQKTRYWARLPTKGRRILRY